MCECVHHVNEQLAASAYPNTMVEYNLFGSPPRAFVATCKRDEKVRGKPKHMIATYCPFCGVKYEDDLPTANAPTAC